MTLFFYNIFIVIFSFFLNLYGLFDGKIRSWNRARQKTFESISWYLLDKDNKPIIWMHCASLGEYEQGLSVIKKIKSSHPDKYRYLLSFFSPSGYNQKKDSKEFDYVFYLPIDTRSKMQELVNTIKPHIFIGVKYELWWNLIQSLQLNNCKIVYISFYLKHNHYLVKSWASSFRSILQKIDHIFTIDELTYLSLEKYNFKNISRSIDTRIETVAQRKMINKAIPEFENIFPPDKPIIVYGSVYPSDIKRLYNVLENNKYYHVIVPHHVDSYSIEKIQRETSKKFATYTDSVEGKPIAHKGIIIDKIGLLFDLYQYASFAYIGGGYEYGIHNTLEPAVYGLPLAFGPRYHNFPEAIYFIKNNCAIDIEKKDFEQYIKSIEEQPRERLRIYSCHSAYFENRGKKDEVDNYINQL